MDIKTKPRSQEMFRTISPNTYREAYGQGMTLTEYLNVELKDEVEASRRDGSNMDGFELLMKQAGIRTQPYGPWGLPASTYEDFQKTDESRALIPEWMARQWRSVSFATDQRALYLSNDEIPGSLANPYADASTPRYQQLQAAIPLTELVAFTTPITGAVYRAHFLSSTAAERRMVRVGEAAEVPRVRLVGADHTVQLYKYGRALEASYESLRRMRIDRIGYWIRMLAIQAEKDKVSTVADVLVNGDGNTGTSATNYNLTTLDSAATAGTLTLKAWLNFKMQIESPYAVTTALARNDIVLQMMLLNMGSANVPAVMINALSGFGGLTAINPGLGDNVRVGWTTDVAANKILAFDNRFAVERVYEVGADIQEVERYATRSFRRRRTTSER